MKKALISVLVLTAAVTTASPLFAAPAAIPNSLIDTGAEQTQAEEVADRNQSGRQTAPMQSPVRQSNPITPTQSISVTVDVTPTQSLSPTLDLTPATEVTPTAAVTTTEALTTSVEGQGSAPVEAVALDATYSEILAGTIIANRSDATIRFFVEGLTFEVAPLRSISLELMRDTAVLNLFNCEASKDDSDAGCFWDPYLLTRDGFYEVVISQQLGQDILLSLRTASAPPSNQIWIQNRTGERETVIVNNELYEIPPASEEEFTVLPDVPVIVQLRSCIQSGDRSVCEWAPQGAEAGYYYGLVRNETPGPGNSRLVALGLQGIVASDGETVKAPPQAFCRLRVPTLNVRSGPGLEFPIIAKIRGTETEPGSVVVVGFDAAQTWMQVTERVARDGWVTSNPEFILCDGDLAALPVAGQPAAAEVTPEPVEPEVVAAPTETSAPAVTVTEDAAVVVEAPTAEEAPPVAEEATTESAPVEEAPSAEGGTTQEEATPQVAEVPEGLARIVVNNPFDQPIRFTLDQKFRPERENLSGEWDLQTGDSVLILVYPGTIAFSVSTPWRGLSDNAELVLAEREERQLWIWFVPDPIEVDRWILQF